MISRRDKLLNHPWEVEHYRKHKQKVFSAKPKVDVKEPPIYFHVAIKQKKAQKELERLKKIERENVRLLQRLGDIMNKKKVENIWTQPRPNFLNRQQMFATKPKIPIDNVESATWDNTTTEGRRKCQPCLGKSIKKSASERIPSEPNRKPWNSKSVENRIYSKCMCKSCLSFKKGIK